MKIDTRKLLFGSFLLAVFRMFAATASAQMAAIAAIDEPEPAEGGGSAARAGGGRVTTGRPPRSGSQGKTPAASTKRPKPSGNARTRTSPAPPPPPPASYRGAVLGDKYTFLNYEVESAEKPYYTRAAKASGAKGLVQVEVLVSTDGSVLSAKARTGNKELWPEAERAALASKFKRPTADGRPARAMGFLVYRFGPAED